MQPLQRLARLLRAALGHQPRGALRDETDEDRRHDGVDGAHPRYGAPRHEPALEVGQHHACAGSTRLEPARGVREERVLTERSVGGRGGDQGTPHVGPGYLRDVHDGRAGT